MRNINEYCNQISSIDEYCKQISINEYLSTKVKVNKISFPDIPKLDTIINFLKENNFIEVKYTNNAPQKDLEDMALTGHNAFMYMKNNHDDDEYWVRFCKSGRLSEENPIYFCRATNDGHIKSYDIGYIEYCERRIEDKKFHEYDEFVKTVNEFFGWG